MNVEYTIEEDRLVLEYDQLEDGAEPDDGTVVG
jgi:hypothetical protein